MVEPIEICDKRYNYLPKTFRWRGHLHHVRVVERCWVVTHHHRRKSINSRCFRVRTANATYDLVQQLDGGSWMLRRVVEEGS